MYLSKIFREYDIRGVVGPEIDERFAFLLGQAYADLCRNESGKDRLRVAVGYDCRLSNLSLSSKLIEGLVSRGVDVVNGGQGPTPQLYFLVHHLNLDGGVMVTASHNPSDQNGFKMMVGKRTLSGDDIQRDIYSRIESLLAKPAEASANVGTVEEYAAHDAYLGKLIELSKPYIGPRKLKVVVDGGNGVGGPAGVPLLRALGCEVIELYTDPDGRFPNHHPDPTVAENIQELMARVRSESADFGIGWDGDADRIGIVDEKGEMVLGDMLLVIFGRALVKEVRSPTVVAEVKCSQAMYDDLRKHGINAVMWKTGHSLIKGKMKELNAELAGEMSGHIFFQHRYFGYDDGPYAAARIVEIMSNADGPFSSLLNGVKQMHATPEIRTAVPEEIKFEIAERAKELFPEYECITIDGVRVNFPQGWALVRASNTQAVLSMRFEAETEAKLEEYKNLVLTRLDQVQKDLQGSVT